MSGSRARDIPQRLQDIQEGLDALLIAREDDPEELKTVSMAYQVFDQLVTLAPADVDSKNAKLNLLEAFLQDMGTPKASASSEEIPLHEKGLAYFDKFERWGNLDDLEQAITCFQRLVNLLPDTHPDKPTDLSHLGAALLERFGKVGSIADLDASILQGRKAVDLTPDGHPDKSMRLSNLGNALKARFHRHGSLADLEQAISHGRKAVDLTPDGHSYKPAYLSNLVDALMTHFIRQGSLGDLEEAIIKMRKAVDLAPDDHPKKLMYLSNLGAVLMTRFTRYGSFEDLEEAISQNRKAVNLTPDDHPNKLMYLTNLGSILTIRFDRQGDLADLEEAISHEWKAVNLTPDDHPSKPACLSNLGNALQSRFDRQGSLADLEEAISLRRMAVNLTPDGRLDKPSYLNNLGNALEKAFHRYGSLASLEEAILHERKAVNLIPDSHPSKATYLNNLGNALEMRFLRQRSLPNLEEAILQKRRAVSLIPDGHPDKPMCLSSLGMALEILFDRHGSFTDLEEAILHNRKAVNLTPDDHPNKPQHLNSLGSSLEKRFYHDGAFPDLGDSIMSRQKAIDLMPNDHPARAMCLNNLGRTLRMRFELLGNQDDLQAALSVAQESAELRVASSRVRLYGALLWAECSDAGSRSSLPAFECAIKLLPRIAWLGLPTEDQYHLLAKAGSVTRDAVAAAIAEDEYTMAVEWAEQGRSIVWQNLLSLRTPLEELRSTYPELGIRLQDLSNSLEQPAENENVSSGLRPSSMASNPMMMAIERDALIEEIRTKPGFGNFMTAKSLQQLAPAVRDGPVIFLNMGMARCDALALLSDDHGVAHVVPIPLERVTLQKSEQLSKRLVDLLSSAKVRARDSRKHRTQGTSDNKHAIFKGILQTLWLDYVQPIVDGLGYQVNLEAPPHLWWCTTGPLAFLPLHAAGQYDVNESGHKLSDYVVSSYTPTLTALLDAASPVSSEEPKILTVAISNTPGAPLPCTEEEVQMLQRLAANLPVVSLVNEEATKERILEELGESSWAHLACHGEQFGGKPMESGLLLHDGKLKLSEIIKAKLPGAEFAFLSACQTALGDGGVPEESAHLAAGMLFAGYRGVVATMWSIQDDIAPRLADDFYRYMFRHGQPKREEAAYALHRAAKSLQESGVPFTSWVPFIHVGR